MTNQPSHRLLISQCQRLLRELPKAKPWMRAEAIARRVSHTIDSEHDIPAVNTPITASLVEHLLREHSQQRRRQIRYALYPSRRTLSVLWGHVLNVGEPFRNGVFVSYSHEDRDWLKRIQQMLKPLVRDETIDLWDDTRVESGVDWAEAIDEAIVQSRAAILLVSPEFLASDYIADVELPMLLEKNGDDLTIFWIPISASVYEHTPLKNLQAASDPARPLDSLSVPDQNLVLAEIAKRLAAMMAKSSMMNMFNVADEFVKATRVESGLPPDECRTTKTSAQQEENSSRIEPEDHGPSPSKITDDDMTNLNPDEMLLLREFEGSMLELFSRWLDLHRRAYGDPGSGRRDLGSLGAG